MSSEGEKSESQLFWRHSKGLGDGRDTHSPSITSTVACKKTSELSTHTGHLPMAFGGVCAWELCFPRKADVTGRGRTEGGRRGDCIAEYGSPLGFSDACFGVLERDASM